MSPPPRSGLLDAVEVTQAIQHLSLAVPLLAGKRTVVRLYLSYYTTPGITVQGQIAVRQVLLIKSGHDPLAEHSDTICSSRAPSHPSGTT